MIPCPLPALFSELKRGDTLTKPEWDGIQLTVESVTDHQVILSLNKSGQCTVSYYPQEFRDAGFLKVTKSK